MTKPPTTTTGEPGTEMITLEDFRDLVAGNKVPEIEDPQQVKMRIIDQVLKAETVDELFAPQTGTIALGAGENIGRRFTIHDVHALRSELDPAANPGVLPIYLLIEAEDADTGEKLVLNTGAARAMAQLWRAKELRAYPVTIEVVAVGQAKPGQNAPIGLAAVPDDQLTRRRQTRQNGADGA